MEEDNKEKTNLFGFGIVMYGFADLLVAHLIDFTVLIGHIFKDYFFKEYHSIYAATYIDTKLEESINPLAAALATYMSFIPFMMGSIGYLKWQFGTRARSDVCLFMKDIKNLFSDAGFVFENAPTKVQFRLSPSIGLRLLHFFDRPKNCFPSLHVILTTYSYLKTKELINKYSSDNSVHGPADKFLRDWALHIIESCLLTKQHGLRDIAGGLAAVTAKFPQFDRQDIHEIISLLFSGKVGDVNDDVALLVRSEVQSVYSQLMSAFGSDTKNDYRDTLVSYVRSI